MRRRLALWRSGASGSFKVFFPIRRRKFIGNSGELAHQIVGIKFVRGQTLQIHIGLELRMELLMHGVVTVQHSQ